jgi:hypothetical protein
MAAILTSPEHGIFVHYGVSSIRINLFYGQMPLSHFPFVPNGTSTLVHRSNCKQTSYGILDKIPMSWGIDALSGTR